LLYSCDFGSKERGEKRTSPSKTIAAKRERGEGKTAISWLSPPSPLIKHVAKKEKKKEGNAWDALRVVSGKKRKRKGTDMGAFPHSPSMGGEGGRVPLLFESI